MRDPFTKQVLQDIASFNNRYLGGILANLFESHPELQEEIADSIIDAVAAKENDNVNKLLEEAFLPGYPDHPTLSDFDASCLSKTDKEVYDTFMTLDCLTDRNRKPNLVLYGPPDCGKEKVAVGLGDRLCREGKSARFIDFHHLMEVLQTHGRLPSSNTLYRILTKVECLIIDDFACMNIHDADLLDSLYVLLRTRIDDHLSPKTKKKIRATFVTTHHHLEDWPRHLIGDDFKVLQIINILYGRGTLLTIDEKAPRAEQEENASPTSETAR